MQASSSPTVSAQELLGAITASSSDSAAIEQLAACGGPEKVWNCDVGPAFAADPDRLCSELISICSASVDAVPKASLNMCWKLLAQACRSTSLPDFCKRTLTGFVCKRAAEAAASLRQQGTNPVPAALQLAKFVMAHTITIARALPRELFESGFTANGGFISLSAMFDAVAVSEALRSKVMSCDPDSAPEVASVARSVGDGLIGRWMAVLAIITPAVEPLQRQHLLEAALSGAGSGHAAYAAFLVFSALVQLPGCMDPSDKIGGTLLWGAPSAIAAKSQLQRHVKRVAAGALQSSSFVRCAPHAREGLTAEQSVGDRWWPLLAAVMADIPPIVTIRHLLEALTCADSVGAERVALAWTVAIRFAAPEARGQLTRLLLRAARSHNTTAQRIYAGLWEALVREHDGGAIVGTCFVEAWSTAAPEGLPGLAMCITPSALKQKPVGPALSARAKAHPAIAGMLAANAAIAPWPIRPDWLRTIDARLHARVVARLAAARHPAAEEMLRLFLQDRRTVADWLWIAPALAGTAASANTTLPPLQQADAASEAIVAAHLANWVRAGRGAPAPQSLPPSVRDALEIAGVRDLPPVVPGRRRQAAPPSARGAIAHLRAILTSDHPEEAEGALELADLCRAVCEEVRDSVGQRGGEGASSQW